MNSQQSIRRHLIQAFNMNGKNKTYKHRKRKKPRKKQILQGEEKFKYVCTNNPRKMKRDIAFMKQE